MSSWQMLHAKDDLIIRARFDQMTGKGEIQFAIAGKEWFGFVFENNELLQFFFTLKGTWRI